MTIYSTRCTINKPYDLSANQAVVTVFGIRESVHPKVFGCQSKLGMAVKTARMFINDSILFLYFQHGTSSNTYYLTLTLGINTFEPLNFSILATLDLCCSKKQKRGMDIVLTVRVKSCKRSASISESLSTALSRWLCSPRETADAIEAIIDAFDCEFDPRCGVPRKTIPATDLMIDG